MGAFDFERAGAVEVESLVAFSPSSARTALRDEVWVGVSAGLG